MLRRPLAASLLTVALTIAGCSPPSPPDVSETEKSIESAAPAPTLIDNFRLTDQTGTVKELYAMTDARAIVLVMQGVGCPIVQKMTPDLKAVQAEFADRNVAFMMINSNIQDTPEMIAAEATNFELNLPILKDADQSVGRKLGAVRTAEVFVVDPATWTIVYHGPLNDRLTYGREKATADTNYVSDVLNAVLSGADVPLIRQEADGCIINFVEPDHARLQTRAG